MVLEDFLKYLQYEKRYSKHTLIAYENDILQFQDFIQQIDKTFATASHKDIRLWIIALMDKQIEPRSVNRKVSSIRSFYKFALKEGIINENPVVKVVSPKVAKKLPVFITEQKMDILLDSEAFEDSFEGVRDRLVIELLFATGIRLNELITLKQTDFLPAEKTIKVLGKRNKERIIPLNLSVLNQLIAYVGIKKEQGFGLADGVLIVTAKGKPAYPKLVYRIVNRYLQLISTQTKKSPHILRHSFATSLLNNGADINAIKDLLGHASLAATQVYTHNSIERLKTIYKQAHPKA
ncbi:tyrosine-type recombinase/integrase [Pedobacter arcticus]|uniref:tyrosine-type recombinase/integrase n=1 Tax=Pedobacter arcticus TaxID=752140 RepID=UPI00030FAA7D|nr:tyrosine-type recombinase/integrase [Pedobacter arcticus]